MVLLEEEFKAMVDTALIVSFDSATRPDNKTRLGTYWCITRMVGEYPNRVKETSMWFVGVAINDRGHVINDRIIYERA